MTAQNKTLKEDHAPDALLAYHRGRGVFLNAIARMHLDIDRVANALFGGDRTLTADFLHQLADDGAGLRPGTRTFALCDRLCSAALDEQGLGPTSDIDAVLAVLSASDAA